MSQNTRDIGEVSLPDRFTKYARLLKDLFSRHRIDTPAGLVRAFKRDDEFRQEWLGIWREIARQDGGKVSLGTVGALVGATLGGVGIAGAWGAFGLPLFAVLGLAGFIAGAKIDSKSIKVRLPKALHDALVEEAKAHGVRVEDLIIERLIMAHEENALTGPGQEERK